MTPELKTIDIKVEDKIAFVSLNRPDKANAINMEMWGEIGEAFRWVDQESEVRVAVLSGAGKHFCGGIDLQEFSNLNTEASTCQGRKAEKLRRQLLWMQDQLSEIEKCRKPVLAAMHGACLGGAIDLSTNCDMRYATRDAVFSIKEIDIGMTADVGTLQRMPKLVGDGIMRELAYTGRNFDGEEAREIGLVNRAFTDQATMMTEVTALARQIASKSPLSIRGVKEMILYTRDHDVKDALNYIATWNAGMLYSNDLQEALTAQMMKREAVFED